MHWSGVVSFHQLCWRLSKHLSCAGHYVAGPLVLSHWKELKVAAYWFAAYLSSRQPTCPSWENVGRRKTMVPLLPSPLLGGATALNLVLVPTLLFSFLDILALWVPRENCCPPGWVIRSSGRMSARGKGWFPSPFVGLQTPRCFSPPPPLPPSPPIVLILPSQWRQYNKKGWFCQSFSL